MESIRRRLFKFNVYAHSLSKKEKRQGLRTVVLDLNNHRRRSVAGCDGAEDSEIGIRVLAQGFGEGLDIQSRDAWRVVGEAGFACEYPTVASRKFTHRLPLSGELLRSAVSTHCLLQAQVSAVGYGALGEQVSRVFGEQQHRR
jgi:hypothetical protein